ncbi:hypothetical protein [Legionella fallonii]|uniref:Uncharacterized protein n=1 Tax=Legionella fallonii LLAP-10 TaxID=1212491 RepID=A0A098G411_9GAMM|nr:hypothetical protein [Legionella fallonii]CEG56719.1 protein of unknown function [Legionella fallonii LLAP-10]
MKPTIFFTDPAKDGDDLLATVHLILQAKAAGVIAPDTPIKLVTTDEIRCNEKGEQDPRGKYGLRALYLNMHLEKIRQQLALPNNVFPEIIPGPLSTYYTYNQEKGKYYNSASESDAFYANEEVELYYSTQKVPESCSLNLKKPNAWIKLIKDMAPDGATLISIAAFNGVSDFIAQVKKKDRSKFSLLAMGYNAPYSNNDEYTAKVRSPNTLPYNARSTTPQKAVHSINAMMTVDDSLHVVSGTTRLLPKYDQSSWLSSFMEIMARAYLLLSASYSTNLLSGAVNFIKSSKYKAFWPHDVVPSLMMVIAQGNWESLGLPPLKKEMLFAQIEKVPASQLHMRMVNDTGVLIDSTIPHEENDKTIGADSQFFTYGKELDVVFFTSLLHFIALQALPNEEKEAKKNLLMCYKTILELKSRLYHLKQNQETSKIESTNLEQQIKSAWATACFSELQQQLSLIAQGNPSNDAQYVLGSHSTSFGLAKLTAEQAKSLSALIASILEWTNAKDINKALLDENLLKWINAISEYMLVTKKPLTEATLTDLRTALDKIPQPATLAPLTAALFYRLREQLMPSDNAVNLLKQKGNLGLEFKRTGNSLIYAELSLGGNLSIPFPKGVSGISEGYRNLLTLKNHSETNKLAFRLHLAIHDAGKGDVIKNDVKLNHDGTYFVRLPDNTYYQLNAGQIKLSDEMQLQAAAEPVDHDAALDIYSFVGSKIQKCSPTEFLIWGQTAPEHVDKEAIRICDELIPLCNEMNIAQVIQGEIPFDGIKKGLDLFFAAYKKDPKMAELVFAHHCFDIYGAAPLDSFESISAGQPEVQLKIELLYKTLLSVAQDKENLEPSKTAFQLYRQRLAKAVPEILHTEENTEKAQRVIAITRVAQMLRCHLFKVKTDANSVQKSIADDGEYEQRTKLFVASVNEAFNQLAAEEQQQLVEVLNRNDSTEGKPAIMVMYGPKLLLTAVTGTEFAPKDPEEQAVIVDRLIPILKLYVKLYNLQALGSSQYSAIEIGELAQILERTFTYYKEANKEQKEDFTNFLLMLQKISKEQKNNKVKEFLEKLPSLAEMKNKSAQEQLLCIQEALKAVNVALDFPTTHAEVKSEVKQELEPHQDILKKIRDNKNVLTKYALQELLIKEVQQVSLTLNQYVELYDGTKGIEELNTHTNPSWDRFFGIHNTASWSNTLKTIRENALNKLLKQLDEMNNDEEKLALLEDAKKLPLFCEHRNNFIIQGAWGRTHSVKLIEEKEDEIRQHSLSLS